MMAEECGRFFGMLADEPLGQVTGLRLEGNTDRAIGDWLGCGPSTVEPRLRTIGAIWGRRG